ncbi:hypothetical protein [Methylobacterium nodulans]|nr:hypothetical protein [Methylobacterium nodulans]
MPDLQSASSLRNRRIMVVEDEYYIADDLRQTFEASGKPAGSIRVT